MYNLPNSLPRNDLRGGGGARAHVTPYQIRSYGAERLGQQCEKQCAQYEKYN